MIYASTSTVINLSKHAAWNFLQNALENITSYLDEISSVEVLESYYDGYLRELTTNDNERFQERVFILKDQLKIITRLVEHPLYQGETIFQIIAPDDDFLSDKKVTLVAVLSWRIHPGTIEAPITRKTDCITQLVENIQKAAEGELR